METSLELQEDGRAKITVSIEAAEVDSSLAKAYKDFANKYNFPGFRKGKAPRAIIDNAFGAQAVPATVTEQLVDKYAPIAIDDSGISPVGDPDFGDAEIMVAKGENFVFSFLMNLEKEFTLNSYEPVEIEVPAAEITDAELESQVEMLVEHYAEYNEVSEGELAKAKDRLTLDLKATDDEDKEISQLCSDSFRYSIGSGLFPESFDENVSGHAVGEKLEFSIPMPEKDTSYTAIVSGKTQNIKFVAEIKKIENKTLPELTDEWVDENLGYESVDEFKDRIKNMLSEQKENVLPRIKENKALAALLERLEGEVPENMVDEAETNLLQDFFRQLQSQGISFDSYLNQQGLSSDEFKEDVKKQARDMAGQDLALSAWARHFELSATKEEVIDEFEKSGAEDPQGLYENWRQAGRLHLVRDGILRQKALDAIIEGAHVTEVPFQE